MTFDLQYPSNPWSNVSTNQREIYDPLLRDIFMERAIFSRYVTTQFNLNGDQRTKTMHITSLIPPHPNFDPIGLRSLWADASHIDSFERTITFNRYGGKVAYHEHDDLITYWRQSGQSLPGLNRIIRSGLGQHMVDTLDYLARNAFLSGSFALYGQSTGTDFSAISSTDKITTQLLDDIHLGMSYRNVPYASAPNGIQGNIVCVTSPGVIYDLKREASNNGESAAFIDIVKYADSVRLLNSEVGTYRNVRFVQTPRATLYNCGTITAQATITAPVTAGDGAPSTAVDGVKTVGQSAATHYITVSSVAGFSVNDILTIHTTRTNAYGITNGVDYADGTVHNLRVVSIDSGNNRISFDRPVMIDFDTDLGGGVYGYVTKGRHIHTAIFLGGADGVVMGVNVPPRLHFPPAVDDYESMVRISWDAYIGNTVFNPEVFEVLYLDGSFRVKGPRQ
ncbi:MAG: hypothetical protein CUN55_00510 [Phototrophicales bacterium]|nr:MAG: hypothetical protein CUN55_00510 [Phototrophicales bacterium]